MVMDKFGEVSEELDQAEMGCHGLVIVLGNAYSFGKTNIAFQNR